MAVSEIAELESVLGHPFRDPRWLVQALTHSSRIPERTADDPAESNEKLEFLGDAVLELLVSRGIGSRVSPAGAKASFRKAGRAWSMPPRFLTLRSASAWAIICASAGEKRKPAGDRSRRFWPTPTKLSSPRSISMLASKRRENSCRSRSSEGAMVAEAERLGRTDHKSALQELLQSRGAAPGSITSLRKVVRTTRRRFASRSASPGESRLSGQGRPKRKPNSRRP